jgi:hypothetical protein
MTLGEKELVKRWREGYRDLLDSWGMWGERVSFDLAWVAIGSQLGEGDDDGGADGKRKVEVGYGGEMEGGGVCTV